MYGGKITGNKAAEKSSVFIGSGSRFNMFGGNITDTESLNNGGGVYISSGGTFTMSGGEISGNKAAENAGGVYVGGTLEISDGAEITGNTANGSNNNVYLPDGKTVTVTGELKRVIGFTTATVPADDNPVKFAVGGIYTAGETKIGGSACIMWNTALTGGGVYVNGGTLTLEGNAKVTGNSATNYRNGIFVSEYGKLCVSGGVQVTDNSNGSNVWLDGTNGVNPISVAGELIAFRAGLEA